MANAGKLGAALSSGGLAELKKRILFVIICLIVYRIGAHISVPGVDSAALARKFASHEGGLLGLFDMFSGGALSRFTIFALGVMPYITASIIVQMFGTIHPKLQQLKKEGEAGKRKMNQYTRYGTVVLSLFQAIGISKFISATPGVVPNIGIGFYITASITLVTGTLFLMWLGEQITERGIGNGISLIIFASIVSRLPSAAGNVFTQVQNGQMGVPMMLGICLFVVAIIAVIVYIERAQRRITIHYAKRMQGNKLYAGQTSHLPLKINMAGVIPTIFAQSIIAFPGLLATFFAKANAFSWLSQVALLFSPGQPLYMILIAVAVIFFSFFYTALTFNPKETAENLKKSGAFIQGIRPGEQTAKYIDKVMTRLTMFGSLYLAVITLIPQFVMMWWNIPLYFGGTSLLIIVVVIMDFIAQVQAHLMSHQYESLMNRTGKKGGKKNNIGLLG